jgi:hypothetical protein
VAPKATSEEQTDGGETDCKHDGARLMRTRSRALAGALPILAMLVVLAVPACPAWAAKSVSGVTASASTYAAGAKRVVDEVSFTATSALGGSGFVQLKAPTGSVFSGSYGDYVFRDGAETDYPSSVTVSPEGVGANVVDVELGNPETVVKAGDTVHISVYGISNPPASVPSGEFAVSTSADTSPVKKPFAITAATAATALSVSTSNPGADASGVADTVSFKATGALSSGENALGCCSDAGYVQLTAPTGTTFSDYDSEQYSVTDGAGTQTTSATVNPEGLGNNVVDVHIPSEVPVKAGETVQVVAHGITNPPSALATGELSVATSSDSLAVKKPLAITAATSISNVSVSSLSPVAGASRVVDEVSFKATSAMPWDSHCNYYYYAYYFGCGHFVVLTAPAGTEFSSSANDYLFTDGADSGVAYYYAEVGPEGAGSNVVRVYLPYEMSVAAGDTIHLTAFGITNPAGAVPAGELTISTAADAKPVSRPLAITAATAVSSVSVGASNYGAGASGVTDTASFKALHAITSGEGDESCCGDPGFVRLTAPTGTEFSSGYYYHAYTLTDGSETANASAEVDPEGLGTDVVDIFIPRNVPIHAGDTVQVTADAVANPGAANPTAEFALSTSSDPAHIGRPFAITAASSISNVSVSSLSQVAGASRVADEISFKATSAMPWNSNCDYYYYAYYFGCGHFVELTAPPGTEFPSNTNDYLFTDGATSGFAYSYAEVSPNGVGDNVVRVYLPYEMSVAAGDIVHLTTFGITNPAAVVPAGELTISTAADAKPVSQPYPIIAATSVSGLSVSASNYAAGAAGVVATASFKALHAIASGEAGGSCCGEPGYVRLTAPTGTEFTSNYYYYYYDYTVTDGSESSEALVEVNPESLGTNVVDVFIPHGMTVNAGDTVQVTAHAVINPSVPNPAAQFALSTSSDPTAITKPFPITAVTIPQEVEPPSISGRAAEDATLREEHGTWNTREVTYAYQWLRCSATGSRCEPIAGGSASAQSYTPVAEDVGHELVAQEIATDAAGHSEPASSSPTSVVAPLPPANTKIPTISGAAQQGQTLTEAQGSWTNEPTTFEYQWLQCDSLGMSCTPIPGASEQTYVPTTADVGGTIEVQEIASNAGGAGEPAVSAPTPVIAGAPPTSTAPPTITGEGQPHEVLAVEHGTWTNQPTSYEEQWLRCEATGENCQPIPGAELSTYTLTTVDDGHTIAVRETASNAAGAGSTAVSAAIGPIEQGPLHAYAGEQVDATAGVPVRLDASGSAPASEITNYEWSLGDGASALGIQVTHTYSSAGTYLAAVTVHRGAESSSAQVKVVVAPAPSRSVKVTMLGTGGAPLSGAQVVYMGSSGHRIEAISDSNGVATLDGLPDGEDTIYAWASEYQPTTGHVTVSGGEGASTVSLTSGALASSSVKSHEMSLAEIEAAGINTSDPANKRVFEFEIDLAFFEAPEEGHVPNPTSPFTLPCYLNSAGEFVGPCLEGPHGHGHGYWICSPGECRWPWGSGGGSGSCCEIIAIPKIVEGHPLIQWLVLRGTATILKQFFTVTMVTQNLSPEPFKLTHGSATLNLPSGLSLAPTAAPQSLTESVPDIPGLGTATTEWVVRGDQTGEWQLSADYKGTLEPFNAPVEVEAALATPLKVWGVNALALTVKADSSALEEGVPYHVTVGVTNNADVPMYNVELALDRTVHANFDFQPDQTYGDTIRELAPGQTLYSPEYILVPDAASVGKFNPALSSATFVGEEVHPGQGIEAVSPPTVYGMSASKAKDRETLLRWEPVPGAEGYEVFSTSNLETTFPEVPDEVTTTEGSTVKGDLLPANATSAYVPEGGWQFYAVSAIIRGAPRLESRVTNTWPTTAYDFESSFWPAGGYGYRFENERMSSTKTSDTYTAQAGLSKAEVLRSSDLQSTFGDWPTNGVQAAKAMATVWEGMEGGVCFGLALSGGRFDSGTDEIYSPSQGRSDAAWKVPTASPPATRQLEAPVGADKEFDRQFLRLTADDFATQYSAEEMGSLKAQHTAYESATGLQALEEQLVTVMGSGTDRYSSLSGPAHTGLALIGLSHGGEGHAVLAYSEEAFEDGTFKIDVWNNDVPGDPPVPGVPEHIIIEPDGTWTSDIPDFEGPYSLNEGSWNERGWIDVLPLYAPQGLHYSPATGASAQIAAGTTIADASEAGGSTPAIWALSVGGTGQGPMIADFGSTEGYLVLEGEHPAATVVGPAGLLMGVHGSAGVLNVNENTGAGTIEAGSGTATLEVTRGGIAVTSTGIAKLGVSASGSVSATAGAAGTASIGIEVEHDGTVETDDLYHGSTQQSQVVEFSNAEVESTIAGAPPTVTHVSPATGPQGGGELVTISGTGLGTASAVRFGSVPAAGFTVISPTSISAIAPPGKGEVDITVTTSTGTSATAGTDRFTYLTGIAPTVTKLSAKKGPAAGRTSVTITGTGFTAVKAVQFGTVASAGFQVVSPTSIVALSPAETTGSVDVTVTTSSDTSAATSKAKFEFESPTVTSVSPRSGPTTGASTITVSGSGFALGAGTLFKFGKAAGTSADCSSTTMCTVLAPAAIKNKAGVVDVRATSTGKTSTKNPADDQYTYVG